METTKKQTTKKGECKISLSLYEKGLNACRRYLEEKGHEIILENFQTNFLDIDFVSIKKDVLVFTICETLKRGAKMPSDDSLDFRSDAECAMAYFLAENNYVDMPVRFDIIKILQCGDNKALLRCHINALGGLLH